MAWFRLIATVLLRSVPRPRAQLDKAILDKERALADKTQTEERAVRFDTVRKAIVAFGFGYGLLVVFCYCFFDLNFFPSGMSTGDVLFFLFAALGVGLMSLFCTALGYSLFLPAALHETCRQAPSGGAAAPLTQRLWLYFASPLPVMLLAYIAPPSFHLTGGLRGWLFLGVGGAIIVLFAVLASRWIKRDRANGGSIDWLDAASYGIGYLFLAPLVCYVLVNSDRAGHYLLMALVCAGVAAALAMSLLDAPLPLAATEQQREKHKQRQMTMGIFLIVALLPALVVPLLRLALFAQLGVRTMDTAVSVDKVNLALLQSAADTAGITLSVCRGEDGTAIVAPVGVLWHATGARSLLQLKDGVDLEVNAAGLKLLRGTVERCVDIKETLLFDSASSTLAGKETQRQKAVEDELQPQLREIGKRWRIKSVKVIGHADPMPLAGNDNETLAQTRADAVKHILTTSAVLGLTAANMEPTTTAAGSRYPIRQCDTREPLAYQRECNKINRRVEVRFRLEMKPRDGTPVQQPPPVAPRA